MALPIGTYPVLYPEFILAAAILTAFGGFCNILVTLTRKSDWSQLTNKTLPCPLYNLQSLKIEWILAKKKKKKEE